MLKIYTIVLRWSLENKTDIMKFFLVYYTCNNLLIVNHSRVMLKNIPSNAPSDVGPGYNEELNFYMNANYINVSISYVIY